MTSRSVALVWSVSIALTAACTSHVEADVVTYGNYGATWKYFPGLAEPSPGDLAAWRAPDFDDSTWASGEAPFGYGRNPPYGVDLSLLDPPMQENYTTLYLRGTFEVPNPSRVVRLIANSFYDDAFVLWINGSEVHRTAGAPADEVLPFQANSIRGHSPARASEISLDSPMLVAGTNVVAVQVLNQSRTSTDLKFDIEFIDTDGPDLVGPRVTTTRPAPGAEVRSLTEIQIVFDEPVTGVDADDLQINGAPAIAVTGDGTGPYIFTLPEVSTGEVTVAWRDGHGITDSALDLNPFAGEPWSYRLDPNALPPELVINEIVAANRTGLTDSERDESGWIEIMNAGDTPVSTEGLSLSNDRRRPSLWQFPQQTIEPGGFVVVFASRKDRAVPESDLHTSFALDVNGGYLGLFSSEVPPEPIAELTPEYPPQAPDVAYGRTSLGTLRYLATPTPGAPNDDSVTFDAIVAQPVADVPHGFFDAAFALGLGVATDRAEIRYTIDGTEPDQESGLLYEGPIEIAGTTPLRARAFRDGWVPSPIFTATYLFVDDVLSQPRLSPAVVNDPDSDLRGGLLSIPSMSIVIDPDEMFGVGGAYSSKGDHAASVELLNPDGDGGFQEDCSIERHSNAGGKTSLRLLFKREYGSPKLRYPLFESAPVHSESAVNFFDRIILRSGKNQSWTNGRFLEFVTYVEDEWVRATQRAMSGIGSHGTFVHLYINGAYWGLYNPVERPDHWFTSAYFGGSERDYFATNFNVTEGSGQHIRGDATRYDRIIELAARREFVDDPAQYEEFLELVDIDKYIDYVILFWFSGFGDGINNNWYAGMRLDPPGKFQFFMWDGEFIFLSTAGPPGNATAWVHPDFFSGSLATTPIVRIWRAFFDHPDFRMRFADRVYKHCFHGGALTREEGQKRLKALTDFLDQAILGESARWGGAHRRDPTWLRAVERLQDKLAVNTPIFIDALRRWRDPIYPSFNPPVLTQQGGEVEAGLEVRSFSADGSIWYTLDGTDPRLPGGDIAPGALELEAAADLVTVHVEAGSTARYLIPTDDSLGTSWVMPDFDDSSWAMGPTGVGYDTRDRITEEIATNVQDQMLDLQSSLYLRVAFDVARTDVDFLWLDVKADDGYVAYLNGTRVASRAVPETLTFDAVATRNGAPTTFLIVDLAEYRDLLVEGRNVLAMHGLNRRANDADFLLLPRLRAGVFGNNAVTIDGTTTLLSRVRTEEGEWSALNAARFTVPEGAPADLQITEIAYNPSADGAEFIEIHNPTAAEIVLDGVSFSNGIRYTFGGGTSLTGGAYLVLARDADVFRLNYPGVPIAGTYVGALANGGERVTLEDGAGVPIVSVDYNDGDFWPLGPDGLGYTLVLEDADGDLDDPRSWRVSGARGGSPGTADEVPLHDGVWIHELLTGADQTVELWNRTDSDIDLSGWYLSTDRTDEITLMAQAIAADTILPAGGYLALASAEPIPSSGGGVYLSAAQPDGTLSGYITGVDFGATEETGAIGFHETSAGTLHFVPLATATPGEPNALPRAPTIAVNELHYHPEDSEDDGNAEFLELFNPGDQPVDLSGWQIQGIRDGFDDGSYVLPPGVVIPPAGFVVVAAVDPEHFRAQNDVPARSPVVGPYGGALSNGGERIRLRKPDGSGTAFVLVDEVDYSDQEPWPVEPDGDGNSLERITTTTFGSEPMTWAASLAAGGTPGSTNTVSDPVEPPAGGLQHPGDMTQDGRLNIVDAIVLLDRLFGADAGALPCEGSLAEAGNRNLLDGDGNQTVDVSDAIRLLDFLFRGGPAHVLGTGCALLEGCPNACGG